MPHSAHTDPLPPLLLFKDGTPVRSVQDWKRRRAEISSDILSVEYGGLPPSPAPGAVACELISEGSAKPRVSLEGARYFTYKISISGGAIPLSFLLHLWVPEGEGPFPVVLNGDGCWSYLTDEILNDVLERKFSLAYFNRCEIALDSHHCYEYGIYKAFPGDYGVLSAWAWAYHRALDALQQLPFIESKKIAITGHSRGGKTVLLAAATDERVAVVGDNESGCGGAGSFHVESDGCETIRDITTMFPFWFAKDFSSWAEREAELPFDQHFLKALIAPRGLFTNVALGDIWSNLPGAKATHEATCEVYRLLDAEPCAKMTSREGPHRHQRDDWARFLDFTNAFFQ